MTHCNDEWKKNRKIRDEKKSPVRGFGRLLLRVRSETDFPDLLQVDPLFLELLLALDVGQPGKETITMWGILHLDN